MVSSKKRGRHEMEDAQPQEERPMIERIRNMWEFANLAQWIYIFGKAVKIDEDLDVEDLEMECMKSHSTVLADIGLALLKFVSSHRGLTPEIFDEYTRRQYVAKAPQRNPFGSEEEPAKFMDFDSFTKIRVLQQLTQWAMINPDRIRERMEEQKDGDQTYWRIEAFGWDSEDRTYIVLDDNRLYRQTAPPPPPPPPVATKKNSKKAKAALRASKRRKLSEPELSDEEAINESVIEQKEELPIEDNGLGGTKWECLAITLDDLNRFVASIEKSRDPNEKILRGRIKEDLLPLLEKQEESRKRKAAQKKRELLNLEKLATAKRSSRIAGKLELQRQEEGAREAERKRQAELVMAKKEQEKWIKLEKERESRMMTREQRLKEREARRILHEEELAGLSEDSKKLEAGESRLSERHLKAEIEKKKQALEELAEEEDWVFDCICGAYGQVDDGSHSISCEKCNIWQHTKCVGITEAAASRDDFHFICKTCRHRAEDEDKTKHRPTIKLKFNRPGSSSSLVPSNQLNGSPANSSSHASNGPQSPVFASQNANSSFQVSPSRPEYESPYSNSLKLSFKSHSPTSNGATPTSSAPKVELRPISRGPLNSSQRPLNLNGKIPRPIIQASPYINGGHAFSAPNPYSPTSLPPPLHGHNTLDSGRPSSSESVSFTSPSHNKPNAEAQSHQRPAPSPSATQDSQDGAHSLPLAQAVLNGQLFIEAHQQSSGHFGEPQSGPATSNTETSQQVASGAPHSPPGAFTIATQMPDIEEHSTVPLTLARADPPVNLLPLNSPPANLNSITSPPNKDSETSLLGSEMSRASALPAIATGISPTKHSTPRPTTSNGISNISSVTPSVLPPVAPLSPSPQLPSLTPPVKSAELGIKRLPGSPLQQAISNGIPIANSITPPILLPGLPFSPNSQQPNLAPPGKVAELEAFMSLVVSSNPTTEGGISINDAPKLSVFPSEAHVSPSPQRPNFAPPAKSNELEKERLIGNSAAP